MVNETFSLMQFHVYNFYAVLMNKAVFTPSATILCKITKSLISAEPKPDENLKKEIIEIYEKTNKNIEEPLSIVEWVVFKNMDRGLNRQVEIGDKEFYLTQLYDALDRVSLRLSEIVTEIAKKYSLDIPMGMIGRGTGTGQMLSFPTETE